MAIVEQFIAAGTQWHFFGFLDTSGRLLGSTTTAPTAGTSTNGGMARVKAIKSANPTVPPPDVVPVTGDDALQGTFVFDSTEAQTFEVSASIFNQSQLAAWQGVIARTFAEITSVPMRPGAADYPDVCWLLNGRAKKKNGNTASTWNSALVPLANVFPRARQSWEERTAAENMLTVVSSPTGQYPFGLTMTDTLDGTDSAHMYFWSSEYPTHMQRFTGNNAAQTYSLDYPPISAAKTLFVVDGIPPIGYPATSVSQSAKTATLTTVTAGASIAGWILYEFLP